MLSARIKPKFILLVMALEAGVWLGWHLPSLLGGAAAHQEQQAESTLFGFVSIAAYLIAFGLNFEISREYRDSGGLRTGWLLLAFNSLVSVGREVINLSVLDAVWPHYVGGATARFHNQLLIIIANTCLAAGLYLIWRSFRRTGLGFEIGGRGWAEIVAIGVIGIGLVSYNQFLTEGGSPYLTSRILQPAGLILLAAAAVMSVILDRMAVRMGGGRLALALRCLTLYTLLRATLVLIEAVLGLTSADRRQTHDALMFLDMLCWRLVPWLAAAAAAYRADLTVQAGRRISEFGAPGGEGGSGGAGIAHAAGRGQQ